MKTLIPYLALSLLSLQVVAACGTSKDSSDDKQIATNLDGEAASEATYLYWIKDGAVFQGKCTLAPVRIDNCQEGVRALPVDAFKSAVANGLAASITQLTSRIGVLETQVPALALQLADLSIRITDAEKEVLAKTEAKSLADKELAQANANMASLSAEITALDAEILANPANQDLKTLRTKRQNELSAETTRKNTLATAATQAAQNLTTANAALAARKLESANIAFEFSAKKSELGSAKTSLVQAQAQSASLDETMTRLANDTIVYDVKAGETIFQNLRPFVSRFAQVFSSGAVFTTELSFGPLDLTIPATGQFGTVDFPMEFAIAATVQDVAVAYDMTHGNPSELTISLINPAGGTVTLRNQSSGQLKEIVSKDGRQLADHTTRTASLQGFDSQQAKGTWKLRITDNFGTSIGKLQSVKLFLKVKAN